MCYSLSVKLLKLDVEHFQKYEIAQPLCTKLFQLKFSMPSSTLCFSFLVIFLSVIIIIIIIVGKLHIAAAFF